MEEKENVFYLISLFSRIFFGEGIGGELTRCSNAICEFGGSPTQALSIFSMAVRCRNNEFIIGVPFGTNGALHK